MARLFDQNLGSNAAGFASPGVWGIESVGDGGGGAGGWLDTAIWAGLLGEWGGACLGPLAAAFDPGTDWSTLWKELKEGSGGGTPKFSRGPLSGPGLDSGGCTSVGP
jgi:hypothetical protein